MTDIFVPGDSARHLCRPLLGASFTLALAMISQAALAQAASDAAATSDEPAARSDADIIVTGTRTVREIFQSSTPMTVLGSDDLAITTPNNLADAVNQLPQLAGGFNPRTANFGVALAGGGLNILNLRNLGPTRTLVLLNGRRVAPTTGSNYVNINTIPQQLVRRRSERARRKYRQSLSLRFDWPVIPRRYQGRILMQPTEVCLGGTMGMPPVAGTAEDAAARLVIDAAHNDEATIIRRPGMSAKGAKYG